MVVSLDFGAGVYTGYADSNQGWQMDKCVYTPVL